MSQIDTHIKYKERYSNMQQTNKKHRFNIIDFLICAIILVAIAFASYIFFFGSKGETTSDTVSIRYTLEVREERDELIQWAEKNMESTLIDGATKYKLGTVADFYYKTSQVPTHNSETGEALAADYPEHSDLYFVIDAKAQRNPSNGRYSIGGFDISVGSLVYVRLPNYTGTSYCISISEIED